MTSSTKQSGFTAIELLITLFVAAAFLVAAYQLFNVVIKDGGQARAESRASNLAYDYMRRYASSATDPCVASTPITDAPITVDSLTNVTVSVAVICLPSMSSNLSKIEVTVKYNSPQQTLTYDTFVNGSGTPVPGVTDGLIGWWKLNGDANTSVGSANGTIVNATPIAGQNGQDGTALYFNGNNSYVTIPALNFGSTNTITVSFWANIISTGNSGLFASNPDATTNRFLILLPWASLTYFDFGNDTLGTGRLTTAFSSPAWNNSWSHWVYVSSPSGKVIYRNATSLASQAGTATFNSTGLTYILGARSGASYFNGTIDDFRIYNRALSLTEIQTLYSAGAQ